MPKAELATLSKDVQQAIAGASAGGLEQAFYWVTPFFVVAVLFLVLQALATSREIKSGGPVRDNGFRLGLVLGAVGLAGLYLRYQGVGFPGALLDLNRLGQFGSVDMVAQIDTVMDVITSVLLVVFTIGGAFLVVTGLTRKPQVDAA
jgi:hypothetical protein